MRRRTWTLLALIAAITAILAGSGEPVWRWATTKRVPIREVFPSFAGKIDGHPIAGWGTVKRWTGVRHGYFVVYYVENGLKYKEYEYRNGAGPYRYTLWNFDGTVRHQRRYHDDAGHHLSSQQGKSSPPWWWDVEDQAEASAPWWRAER